MTTDVDAAKRFYGALFGWETEGVSGAGMPYTLIKVNGEPVGGMMAPSPECTGSPAWGVCVTVDDVDATAGGGNPGWETSPPTDRHSERRPLLRPSGPTRRDLVRDHVSAALNAAQARPSGSPPVARNQGPTVFALIGGDERFRCRFGN